MADETIWSLLVRLEADGAQLRRELDSADRRLDAFERSVSGSSRNVGAGLSQMGRGAGQVATGLDKLATRGAIAAGVGLAAVVKAAIDFDAAFAGVRKTVDATPAALAAFREELRGMAREIPIAHGELAALAEAGGALGVGFDPATGRTNLATLREFTRISALVGETTDVSSRQAATSLGVLSNVLGLVADDYDNFGSTLVDLGNKGASTESAILAIAERAGSGAKLIHLSAAETLGWSSAVANLGIEVEAGGSSLQRFFQMSLESISEGGKELDIYARTAGMARDEFAELFGRDSSRALATFVEGLGELEEAERLAVLKALGFSDVRISRALLGLSGDADDLTDSLNIAATAWEQNSALGEEAAKRFATTQAQLDKLGNNAKDAAITIGDELLPIVNELARDAVEFLIAHRADIKDFGQSLAAGIRDLGGALRSTDWDALLSTLSGAAAIAKTAFDAFMSLPDPVKQLAIAAIVGQKVTGGALGDIAKGFANIFGGALRTIRAGHVTVIGPGGGLPGAGGKGGLLGTLLKGALSVVGGAVVGSTVGKFLQESTVAPAREFALGEIEAVLASGDADRIEAAIGAIDDQLHTEDLLGQTAIISDDIASFLTGQDSIRTVLDEQKAALIEALAAQQAANQAAQAALLANADALRDEGQLARDAIERVEAEQAASRAADAVQAAGAASADAAMLGSLSTVRASVDAVRATIAAKDFSPFVSVSVSAQIFGDTIGTGITGARIRGRTPVAMATGAMDVPRTGLAMLHAGEMVIPRFDAEALREIMGNRGGDGGRRFEFHEGAIQINNPTPEPASRSQARALRDIAFRMD